MTEYPIPEVRSFIFDHFDDIELDIFCHDYFREVSLDFTEGMKKRQKVQMLIGYCERREQIDNLRAALYKERKEQFISHFENKWIPPETSIAITPSERDERLIFISYDHMDYEFAHRLGGDLESDGWRIWIAPDSIQPGERWAEAIERGLNQCGKFIVVLTKNSVTSDWVRTETNLAIELEHKHLIQFIPVKFEECDIPLIWGAYQYYQFEDYSKGLQALLTFVNKNPKASIPSINESVKKKDFLTCVKSKFSDWKLVALIASLLVVIVVFLLIRPWDRWVISQVSSTLTPHKEPSIKDNMELILIPAGKFLMGSAGNDPDANPNEKPQHEVYLDAYWIDSTEITNKMFAIFVDQTKYKTVAEQKGASTVFFPPNEWKLIDGADWKHPFGPESNISDLENNPVVHVSWEDAHAYCQWAGRRLPTEAEWEKAARGTDDRIFPWGNQSPNGILTNYNQNVGKSSPVGSYPDGRSPYGAYDMAGNVWEWVADYFSITYYREVANKNFRNPQGPSSAVNRVMRGGSWYMIAVGIRAAYRGWDDPNNSNIHVGFRCARSN